MPASGGQDAPAYAWVYPSQNAFVIAQGATGSSFVTLVSWLNPQPTVTLPAGVASLTQLLPSFTGQGCTSVKPQWAMPGLIAGLSCSAAAFGGYIYAFQADSAADFQTAWLNFNLWWGFDAGNAQTTCPPQGSGAHGVTGFESGSFPPAPGQVLECQEVSVGGSSVPALAWTYPTEDALIIAEAVPGLGITPGEFYVRWQEYGTPSAAPHPGY